MAWIDELNANTLDFDARRQRYEQLDLLRFAAGETLDFSPVATLLDDPQDKPEDLLAFARAAGNTGYHPVGTCRMGNDSEAVVDPGLRLNGLDRLYVADASVMPAMVSGNTYAASNMIAEKAADMIPRTT